MSLALGSDPTKFTCLMTYNVGVLPQDGGLWVDVKEARKKKTQLPQPSHDRLFQVG